MFEAIDMVQVIAPPWERLLSESSKAHSAFQEYLRLGPSRSLRAAASAFYNGESAAKLRQVERWSARFGWPGRARAWDEHQDGLRRAEADRVVMEEAARQARDRERHRDAELDLSRRLIERAKLLLSWPIAETTTSKDGQTIIIRPARWRMRDVATLMLAASKIGRLALDMETERSRAEVTTPGRSATELAAERVVADATEAELRAMLDRIRRDAEADGAAL